MDAKNNTMVVSSYSCLSKLSPSTEHIHFRKFVSKKLIDQILTSCAGLKKISLPRHMSEKLNQDIVNILTQKNIAITISDKSPGRPNMLDNMLYRNSGWKPVEEYNKMKKAG